ncbi:hypothetical protein LCGC14_1965030 [marine sediment metagenome]|uniref:Uncharacterized protein n=1 Tax=marine sediment metagenome TaxID=412755 RepID=A0A0F9HRW1_9ZZZZ
MTDKHTPCACRATEHIFSREELQYDKEAFERTGKLAEPRVDILYCPLHAAAPGLLEALEGRAKQAHVASRGMAEVSEDAYPSSPHLGTFDECPADGCVKARAIIKAAK